MKVKISIVMPMFNAQTTVARAISSVQFQTKTDWELIVVDDASTDQSCRVVEGIIRGDARIRLIRLAQNSGAAVARNTALDNANGTFIAFLDSDDEWHPEKLEKQIGFMQEHDLAFTCTGYLRFWPNGKKKIIGVPYSATREKLLKNNTVATLTAIYDKSKFNDVRMPPIVRRQDYAFWLCLLEETEFVYGLNETLATYHLGHQSLSSNKLVAARDQWRFYSEVLNLNIIKKLWYFIHYAINGSSRNI